MFKTRSYKLVDAIANHPDVRPTIEGGDHYISSAGLLGDMRNIVFADEHGIIIFTHAKPGAYMLHIGMLKSGRGAYMLKVSKECLNTLFTQFEASLVMAALPLTLPPKQLRGMRLFCRLLGFCHAGADGEYDYFHRRA